MQRFVSLFLLALVAFVATQAGATNLLQNGSFQTGDFTDWTLGTTSNGTPGQGFPIVVQDCLFSNCWEGEVGEVNSDNTPQGATISQQFYSPGGMTVLSMSYIAEAATGFADPEGGEFRLLLDGTVLDDRTIGPLSDHGRMQGTLVAGADLAPGMHTFEVEALRKYLSVPGQTPYQYLTAADVENYSPEPGSLILMGSGALGLAGVVRRKRF